MIQICLGVGLERDPSKMGKIFARLSATIIEREEASNGKSARVALVTMCHYTH